MQIEQLLILLPCHSLDDFPIYHEGKEAEELLASWSALWHPAHIAAAGSMPAWRRADDPPLNAEGYLMIIPSISSNELQSGFEARVANEGGQIVKDVGSWPSAVDSALLACAQLTGADLPNVDPDLIEQFLAVAFAYLQVELLTRQMRYASSLDQHHFESQIVDAAKNAVAGNREETDRHLTACIDALGQERDHYYPVDVNLVELTLTAAGTLDALATELDSVTNLMITGELLACLGRDQPMAVEQIKARLASGDLCIIGGEHRELPLTLLSAESIRRHFIRSQDSYREILGAAPVVYGRRRYGLSPLLPTLLNDLGYVGCIHATFDDGQFPESSQTKTFWQGLGDVGIDAIGKVPMQAHTPETFLRFAVDLSDSMDHDHVATRVLARWPGRKSDWHRSLERIAEKSPVLGNFVTLQRYFTETAASGDHDDFRISKYRSPYLRQAVAEGISNPLTRWVDYQRRERSLLAQAGVSAIKALSGATVDDDASDAHQQRWQLHLDAIETSEPVAAPDESSEHDYRSELANCFGADSGEGILVINPFGFVRRCFVDASSLKQLPNIEKPVYAAATAGKNKYVIVDVPPMGFAWLGNGDGSRRNKREPSIVEELTLRNEFFHATLDKTTGALRSLRDYKSRGNRGSQQLVVCFPRSDERSSVMAADKIETIENSTVAGCIQVSGRLLDKQGTNLADYTQHFRVERGNRILQIRIELEPKIELSDDPWESYIANRLAWSSEAGEIFCDVHGVRKPSSSKRLESPRFVEVDEGDRRTLVLTEGLPYHRRIGPRMLDTLLMVKGEGGRQFHLGIGSDVRYPVREAITFGNPVMLSTGTGQPSSSASTWLMHIDAKNVVVCSSKVVRDESGRSDRLQLILQETEGRQANATLRFCRTIQTAKAQTLAGSDVSELEVSDGSVKVQLNPHHWQQIEVRW